MLRLLISVIFHIVILVTLIINVVISVIIIIIVHVYWNNNVSNTVIYGCATHLPHMKLQSNFVIITAIIQLFVTVC